MNLKDWIRKKILNFLGAEQLSENPNSERLNFISNEDDIKREELIANKIWFTGNGDELLNYYTNQEISGFARNPIYNRNKRNYFWGLSSAECDIKRVHSGFPHAMVSTICDVIGNVKVSVGREDALTEDAINRNKNLTKELTDILEFNDFHTKLTQQARPLTSVCGWGAWKPIIDKDLSPDKPLLEFCDGENVDFIVKCGVIVGVIFKTYYKDEDNRSYVLLENRYINLGNSYIDYDLFRLKKNNDLEKVPLGTIPALADLKSMVIEGLNKILAVPTRYFYDPLNPKYGKSIYAGKLDVFDDIDLAFSQLSHCIKVSGPVEYYNVDILETSPGGVPIMPSRFNRDFIAKHSVPNGDGVTSGKDIETTQPDLNFEQYVSVYTSLIMSACTGTLSPATLGIDIAKKDNAEAQREKEKVTLFTRSNIIDHETKQNKELMQLLLMLSEYLKTGVISIQDYDINIKYDEFATPSFDNELQVLGGAWSNGQISTRKYVELLWGDKLSKADQDSEIEWLDNNRSADNLDIDTILGDGDNVNGYKAGVDEDISTVADSSEKPTKFKK